MIFCHILCSNSRECFPNTVNTGRKGPLETLSSKYPARVCVRVCACVLDDLQRLESMKGLQGCTGHHLQLVILKHPEVKMQNHIFNSTHNTFSLHHKSLKQHISTDRFNANVLVSFLFVIYVDPHLVSVFSLEETLASWQDFPVLLIKQ